MNRPIPLLSLLLLLLVPEAWGQNRIVAGRLTGKNQEPLPGATIVLKGTSTGTVTDLNGQYKIAAPLGSTLVISFIGFTTREVKVSLNNSVPAAATAATAAAVAAPPPPPQDSTRTSRKKARPLFLARQKPVSNGLPEGEATLTDDSPSFVRGDSSRPENPESNLSPVYRIRFQDQNSAIRKFGTQGERGLFILEGYSPRQERARLQVSYLSSFTLDQPNRLPALQTEYAQGRPVAGTEQAQGPATGETFSWGPAIRNLEFDGQPTAFDKNGSLVPRGQGNGRPANTYTPLSFFKTGSTLDHSLGLSAKVRGTDLHVNYGHRQQAGLFPGASHSRNNLLMKVRTDPGARLNLEYLGAYAGTRHILPGSGTAYARLLAAAYLSPPSFDQAHGYTRAQAAKTPEAYLLATGGQRSHSPGQADNPYWLVNTMPDASRHTTILSNATVKYKLTEGFTTGYVLGLSQHRQDQELGLARGTAGSPGGRFRSRDEKQDLLNSTLYGRYRQQLNEWALETGLNYDYNRDHRLLHRELATGYEATGSWELADADDRDTYRADKIRHRHETAAFAYLKYDDLLNLRLTNRTYASTTLAQPRYFLPAAGLGFNIHKLEPVTYIGHIISSARLYASFSRAVNEAPLLYSKWHHNTLPLQADQFLSYFENTELVHHKGLEPEQLRKFETGLDLQLLYSRINLVLTYFNNLTTKAILPVQSNAGFALQNAADIQNKGFEMQLTYSNSHFSGLHISPGLNLLLARPTVSRLHAGAGRLPVAGFRDISTNLVAGAPYGVIYGSRYRRNGAGQVLIGPEGFPLVDDSPGRIGNPNPDWTAGFHNTLGWRNLSLSFVFDIRKGGDLWNGTRSVLNYYGASRESQQARSTRQYIFEGVQADGSPNTIPVDFANPQNGLAGNRWLRYGMTGVGEEFIEDASWIRLNELKVTYRFDRLLQKLLRHSAGSVSLLGKNLWFTSPYGGVDPAAPLFGYEEGQGLNLFNAPGTRSYGMALQVKF